MKSLSLLTNKGFLASKELHAEIERTMESGELRTRGYVLTTRSEFHPFAADSQVTETFAEPAKILSESNAIALITSAELIHREKNLVKVELSIESRGDSISQVELSQLRIGRYSPDADANGLSFMNDAYSCFQEDGRRDVMKKIHDGLGAVIGHRVFTLPDRSADSPTIQVVSYPLPGQVSDGHELKQWLEDVRRVHAADNVVTVLLEMSLTNSIENILVELFTRTPNQLQGIEDHLEDWDWFECEDAIFHLLKFWGKAETKRTILNSLATTPPFKRVVTFEFDASEDGDGDPFLPEITLSVDESLNDVADIQRKLIKAFDLNSPPLHANGRVSWNFYPGEGPFVLTASAASHAIDEFSAKLASALNGVDLNDAVTQFHICLF